VARGTPAVSRIVTVTGSGVASPANVEARLGTPIADLVGLCGGYRGEPVRLIAGGSMTGRALATDAIPVTLGLNCVLVATRADVPALQGFVSKYNLNFTNINDADGSIWARFNVPWQPAYVFLRPDGSSSFVNNPTSVMSAQELTERVRALTS